MESPDSLQEKVERLEEEVQTVKEALPTGAKPIEINRRSFLLTVGGAAAAGAATGRVAAQTGATDGSGVSARAQIIGNGPPPDPNSEFFKNKAEYHYEYLNRDNGARWVIENSDSDWSMLPVTTEDTVTDSLAFSRETAPQFPQLPDTPGGYAAKPHPYVDNPIFDSSTHADWDGGADPFIIYEPPYYYVFFEGFAASGGRDIALTRSPDLINWSFQGAVLEESWDQGYSFMQKLDGTWYMIPTNASGTEAGTVRIYEVTGFPSPSVSLKEVALDPANWSVNKFGDPTPFYWPSRVGGDDNWYLIAQNDDSNQYLFYSDTLLDGNWSAHPSNPIRSPGKGRGTPIVGNGYVDIWDQPDVTAVRIHELSTTSISMSDMGQVIDGHDNGEWNSQIMHHFDPLLTDRGCPGIVVDGNDGGSPGWSLGIYTFADKAASMAVLAASSNQSIANTTFTDVSFDTVSHSVPDIFEDTSNNQITVEQSGYYAVSGSVGWASTGGSSTVHRCDAYNVDTGTTITGDWAHPTHNNNFVVPLAERTEYLNAGDTIKLRVWQDSGGSQTLWGNQAYTWLNVRRVH